MGIWRTRAVRSFLVEDVAALRPDGDSPEEDFAALQEAEKRGRAVVALDWFALLVLVVARSADPPALQLGRSIESVFTLGLLAIAVHSGFRLGQLEKYRAVRRKLQEFDDREVDE